MEEFALIRSARQGDLEAFNRLVLIHQDAVYNQAFWILRSREDAEDATQETFIRAYTNLSRFRNGFFLAWLLRIVTNTCIDELRRTG